MYTVTELERLTKLTRKQVYDRLRLLSQLLNGELTSGRNGRKLLSEQGFAVFNRFRALEVEGLTGQAVVNLIAQELGKADRVPDNAKVSPSSSAGKPEEMESVQALLTEKDKRLQDKDAEIRYLRERLSFLEGQLALPAPKPRPRRWLSWLWGRSSGRPIAEQ